MSLSRERWDKTRTKVVRIVPELGTRMMDEKGRCTIDRKLLEPVRGFWAYISMTYLSRAPHLKVSTSLFRPGGLTGTTTGGR
jgi:hypothetical protein